MNVRFHRPGIGSAALCAALLLSWPRAASGAPGWETSVYPEDEIFPSLILSTATAGSPDDTDDVWDCPQIGDKQGLVGALISGAHRGDKVRVVVRANSLMEESVFDGVAPKKSGELLVHPKIKFRYDALAKVHQQRPLDVSMEAWVNGESLGEKTVTVTVHSINDCLFGVLNDDGDWEYDANWNFAAYVNENHPWVDEILRDALDTGIVKSFDGYQSGDAEQTLLQVYAIWNVMQRRGMHYSNITTTASESETVLSQHVRLLDESIRAKQANCVDGTVLFASVLRKIGLSCQLALEPGHMFLVVDLDDDTTVGVETTMMGEDDLAKFDEPAGLSKKKRETLKNQASFRIFEEAVDEGTRELEKHQKKFEGDDTDYLLIDVAEARREGIMPIGYSQ